MRKPIFKLFIICTFSIFSFSAHAGLCKKWSESQEVGKFANEAIDELSGMAASSQYERLYNINDSGDMAKLYVTDLSGKMISTTFYDEKFWRAKYFHTVSAG